MFYLRIIFIFFFFSSRRRHTRSDRDWSSDVCSSDLYGEMALSYALHRIESQDTQKLTNYGEFLEKFPPTHEVQIIENTSWSCIHGVERWRANCGCNAGHPGWSQERSEEHTSELQSRSDLVCR